jgi:ubiquinone/menaquinone biosynthesis C-methylase UbiE
MPRLKQQWSWAK